MRKNTKKWIGAVLSALVVGIPVLVLAALFLGPSFGLLAEDGEAFAAGILAVYGLVLLAVGIGVFVALHQRKKELEKGEEEDARKY